MHIRNSLIITTFITLSLSMQGWAADEETQTVESPKLEKTYKVEEELNPWTDCGIGAMLFDETKWAAVTSNIIWDWGLTATTSAVSSKHTCEGKQVVAALFINNTYANLEEQTASGNGKHLTALLDILGCDGSAQTNIIQAVRNDFAEAVTDVNYATLSRSEKAQQYYFIVDKQVSSEFASQCNAS